MNTKTILNIYITIMLFFGVFGFAYSAEYTVLSPLPGTTSSCSGETCKSNLEKYLPGFFKLLIGVGAGLGFVMLTYEGFQYVLTDSFPVKSNARGKIQDILTGLGLIICSYAILYTINPRTLNLRLDLPSVAQIKNTLTLIDDPSSSTTRGTGGTNGGNGRAGCQGVCPYSYSNGTTQISYMDCLDCVPANIFSLQHGTINGQSAQINRNLARKLTTIKNTQGVPSFQLSETWPPTSNHIAQGQYNGTSVDLVIGQTPTASQINSFLTAANNNNVLAQFEVTNDARRTELINQGVPPASILTVPQATGEHFSIYNRP